MVGIGRTLTEPFDAAPGDVAGFGPFAFGVVTSVFISEDVAAEVH